MVKTAEKDAATSPESPFFDGNLTQCALSDVFRQGFFIGRKKSQGSRVWKAHRLRFASLYASRNMRRLYKMDVPPC